MCMLTPFLQYVSEGRVVRRQSDLGRYTFQEITERIYLSFLALTLLRSFDQTVGFVNAYATVSYEAAGNGPSGNGNEHCTSFDMIIFPGFAGFHTFSVPCILGAQHKVNCIPELRKFFKFRSCAVEMFTKPFIKFIGK